MEEVGHEVNSSARKARRKEFLQLKKKNAFTYENSQLNFLYLGELRMITNENDR